MKPDKPGVPAINELVPYRAVLYEQTNTANRFISVPSRDIRVLLFIFVLDPEIGCFGGSGMGLNVVFLLVEKKKTALVYR